MARDQLAFNAPPEDLTDALAKRLETLRAAIRHDPLRNPVRELSHEVSRALEAGTLTRSAVAALIEHLDKRAFARRARHVASFLGLDTDDTPTLSDVVSRLSAPLTTWDAFEKFWSHRHETLVFTGHPTFVLSEQARLRLAEAAAQSAAAVPAQGAGLPDRPITLDREHEQATSAMAVAAAAIRELNAAIIQESMIRFPGKWQTLLPSPIGLATWVGYDMDGRTDIGWASVIRHRLDEKAACLARYRQLCTDIPDTPNWLTTALTAAYTRTTAQRAAFSGDMTDPDALKLAADGITTDVGNVTTVAPWLEGLANDIERLVAEDKLSAAQRLAELRAEMALFKLGQGDIHFRLNAAQIRNTARRLLSIETDEDLFGRGALQNISTAIEQADKRRVNFASLATERDPTVRLFMAMAQIVKHIDADAPIRLLIAECENPVTVLAAIHQATVFGVADSVDVCPLFETATSLERGGRLLDVLARQPAYKAQVAKRGCISIETGFSDAGRFMGQIPAALAIERLQGQLAETMERQGLTDIRAIIYDTHGESMGRGGHPSSMRDRCHYALSPWARAEFASRGIALCHEQSFQGGDGYVWFSHPRLATHALVGILDAIDPSHHTALEDPFYRETSASLDFFNSVKRRQEELFVDPAYNVALAAMGASLLPKTGSRATKRQFDRQADEESSLRRIRAIPHNGILQQMGFLANILGGVGSAIAVEPQAFDTLAQQSDRFARLMRLVGEARRGSDMKTFIAYMKLYDGSFWATRPITGEESGIEEACALLARHLSEDHRYFAGLQLAARLRSDSIALSRAFASMGMESTTTPGHTDIMLDLLHVVRLALIQHLFLTAAALPAQSPGSGVDRSRVLSAIFALDVGTAVDLLQSKDELGRNQLVGLALAEEADPDPVSADDDITEAIDALVWAQDHIHRISVGIANHFGAVG